MNQFVQDCSSIDEKDKEHFQDKFKAFLAAKNVQPQIEETPRYFLTASMLCLFLRERLYEKFVLSPEQIKEQIVDNLKEALKKKNDENRLDEKEHSNLLSLSFDSSTLENFNSASRILSLGLDSGSRDSKIAKDLKFYESFLGLFEKRIEINLNFDNLFSAPSTAFKDSS